MRNAIVIAALLLSIASDAFAQPLQIGDFLMDGCCGGYPTSDARLLVLRQGNLPAQQFLSTTEAGYFQILTDADRDVFILRDTDIQKVSASGEVLATWQRPDYVFSAALRADGSMVVSYGTRGYIDVIDSNGSVLRSIATLSSQDHIDLAADQCTLFGVLGDFIHRYDVCAGVEIAPVPVMLPTPVTTDLRIAPNGDLLVAGFANGPKVFRVTQSGTIARIYNVDTLRLALSVDRRTFWSIGTAANQVDLATGAVLRTITVPQFDIQCMAVVGEYRAALPPTDIPALSPLLLVLLAVVLASGPLLASRSIARARL